MKKIILCSVILLSSICFGFGQDPLPKGLTNEEIKDYNELISNPPKAKSISQPAVPPRTPAEWEEAQGVIVTWASFSYELREIVKRAKEAVTVYIICSNPTDVQNYLSNGGVNLENIVLVQAPFNTVWVRDYGPQSIYLENNDLAFINWEYNRPRPDDNEIPEFMADYFGIQHFDIAGDNGMLIATGGNFMTDGHGTAFSSKLILGENSSYSEADIDDIKYDYMGIDRYIKMDELPYDIISHIDMHMKLLDEETILVGQFPQGVSDGPYIENNIQYVLDNFKTAFDNDYEIVRIPMVPSSGGNYPPSSDYRTFTNAIILNNIILVPQYGHALDETGLETYREAMPGYEVYGINMENVIPYAGAIHCISREIAADDPVHISHAKKRLVLVEDEQIDFKAVINSESGISEAQVFWTINPDDGFNSIDMTFEEDAYYAYINDLTLEEEMEIHYYISATNNNSKTITKPLVAPDGYYSFEVKLVDDTSVEEYIKPTFSVYPNPANSILNLSISPEFAGGEIKISNISGAVIYSEQLDEGSDYFQKSIPLNNFAAGVFFITISNNEFFEVKKFIKN